MPGLTLAKVRDADFKDGNKQRLVRTITFDSSYPTGGEALTKATLGVHRIFEVLPHGPFRNTDGTLGITVAYDYTNSKLAAYWGNAGSVSGMPEVADTTDLSTYSGRVTFICN
jgi:hypothetical protein